MALGCRDNRPIQGTAQQEASGSSSVGTTTTKKRTNGVPDYVLTVLAYVRAHGEAPEGYVGGRIFQNRERRLPSTDGNGKKARYQEWDVHPKKQGKNRGAERLITSADDAAWYTADHYKTFKKIE